jgi:hypothetical protein
VDGMSIYLTRCFRAEVNVLGIMSTRWSPACQAHATLGMGARLKRRKPIGGRGSVTRLSL